MLRYDGRARWEVTMEGYDERLICEDIMGVEDGRLRLEVGL